VLKRHCQFCDKEATYDFRTQNGQWAYGCDDCRRTYGLYKTDGVGKATRLDGSTTKREIPAEIRKIAAEFGFDGGDDEIEAMMGVIEP
jgi:hypothetical protein